MQFEIVPAAEIPLAEQAVIANAAFANYVGGWTEMDASSLARFLLAQGTDLFYSRFVRTPDGLAGFGYINRTGNVLRLSGMALVPAARGTGAAGYLLEQLFADAQANGDVTMILEVIEQNPRAVAFYRRHGFRELTRLVGWRRAPGEAANDGGTNSLEEVSLLEALCQSSAREYPEISWPICRYAIAKVPRTRAYRVGGVCVVVSDPETAPIRIHGLFCPSRETEPLRAAVEASSLTSRGSSSSHLQSGRRNTAARSLRHSDSSASHSRNS